MTLKKILLIIIVIFVISHFTQTKEHMRKSKPKKVKPSRDDPILKTAACCDYVDYAAVPPKCMCNKTKCIGPNSTVFNKNIRDIKIGDYVIGYDGKQVLTKVIGWIHFNNDYMNEMYVLTTQNNKIELSDKHYIAILQNDNVKYVYSDKVNIGDIVLLENGKTEKIIDIKREFVKGYYALMTETGNFYANNMLVHCFAHVEDPELYVTPMKILLSAKNAMFIDKTPREINDWVNPMVSMFV